MYNCVQSNLQTDIVPQTIYTMDDVKIEISIGACDTRTKRIHLGFFPTEITYNVRLKPNSWKDTFSFDIIDHYLVVTRTDQETGWGHHHVCELCIKYKQSLQFCQEYYNGKYFYIQYKHKKIALDPIFNLPMELVNKILDEVTPDDVKAIRTLSRYAYLNVDAVFGRTNKPYSTESVQLMSGPSRSDNY
mgnify:CR=1 FL=1